MSEFFTKSKVIFIIGIAFILFLACEREPTRSVFVEDPEVRANPIITSIEPADGALSGIGQITIKGSNFSSKTEENLVFFGSDPATIIIASESELVVQTPQMIGDSIEVKVSVIGALLYSNPVYYTIQQAVEEIGGYGNLDEDLYAIAADTSENVYVAAVVSPQFRIDIITPNSLGTAQPYGTANIPTRGMKMGPGGYLYLAKGSNKILYRIPPGGGGQEPFILFPQNVYDLDFDLSGNIYIAGGDTSISNLIIVYPDKSFESVADYTDTFIKAVRVYDDYVYVAGFRMSDSLEAVWRNQILSAPNDLGPNEMVFDVTAELGQDIEVQSLTFAEDGDMYVGTTALDPILVVHPDGSHEPLYPGVLGPQMFDMAWGNDVYLYVSRRASVIGETETRILKINMQKMGAPYYGRQL